MLSIANDNQRSRRRDIEQDLVNYLKRVKRSHGQCRRKGGHADEVSGRDQEDGNDHDSHEDDPSSIVFPDNFQEVVGCMTRADVLSDDNSTSTRSVPGGNFEMTQRQDSKRNGARVQDYFNFSWFKRALLGEMDNGEFATAMDTCSNEKYGQQKDHDNDYTFSLGLARIIQLDRKLFKIESNHMKKQADGERELDALRSEVEQFGCAACSEVEKQTNRGKHSMIDTLSVYEKDDRTHTTVSESLSSEDGSSTDSKSISAERERCFITDSSTFAGQTSVASFCDSDRSSSKLEIGNGNVVIAERATLSQHENSALTKNSHSTINESVCRTEEKKSAPAFHYSHKGFLSKEEEERVQFLLRLDELPSEESAEVVQGDKYDENLRPRHDMKNILYYGGFELAQKMKCIDNRLFKYGLLQEITSEILECQDVTAATTSKKRKKRESIVISRTKERPWLEGNRKELRSRSQATRRIDDALRKLHFTPAPVVWREEYWKLEDEFKASLIGDADVLSSKDIQETYEEARSDLEFSGVAIAGSNEIRNLIEGLVVEFRKQRCIREYEEKMRANSGEPD